MQVCEGKSADFNKAAGYGGALDPKEPEDWPESRRLRPVFLETMLLHEPWRRAVPRQDVRIVGARFTEELNLSDGALAHVLRQTGRKGDAKEILYGGRERERQTRCRKTHDSRPESCELLHLPWVGLSLQNMFIGYGYRLYYALYWAIGTTLLGMIVLVASGETTRHRMRYYGLAYSLDMLVPIIELRKGHTDGMDLNGWARVYFYVHKVFGYVLALFLAAGLTGLTQ